MRTILPLSYYKHDDVIALGKDLCTRLDNCLTCGIITETESYQGPEDRASHAYQMRRTKRNEVMYHQGGTAYVYFCYGLHALFNVVTGPKDLPHAILIRGIVPVIGLEIMAKRRKKALLLSKVIVGPGVVSQVLGIGLELNGASLVSKQIWIEDTHITIQDDEVEPLPRVGIDYAGEHALLPWRFRVRKSSLETIIQNVQSMHLSREA